MKRLVDCAALVESKFAEYDLLDVGCRTKDLKPLIPGCRRYQGLDMVDSDEVIGCNLEEGIPFPDKTFDIAIALDVIEHLERAHFVVTEMLRVARKGIVVSLPNMYYWSFRINFLLGRGISGKYTFPPKPPTDRHRWMLSYKESEIFMKTLAGSDDIEIYKIMPQRGRLKNFMPYELMLADKFPNLLAYGSLFYIAIQ